MYYMQRNPGNFNVLLGKIFVFAFTWSFGGCFKRQDDMEDDIGEPIIQSNSNQLFSVEF